MNRADQIIIADRYPLKNDISIMCGTWLGNPFPTNKNTTPEQSVEKYRVWLRSEYKLKREPYRKLMELVKMVQDGQIITLACPEPRHGEVIKDAILKIKKNG
jgi:hypothetical protein